MVARNKTRQNRAKNVSAETVIKTVIRAKRLKAPGPRLAELIASANLIPAGTVLRENIVGGKPVPTYQELERAVQELPKDLRHDLSVVLDRGSGQPLYWGGPDVGVADQAVSLSPEIEQAVRVGSVIHRYNEVRKARELLDQIIVVIGEGEIGLVRKCKLCGRVFFAGRRDQWHCSPECAKKARQRKWKAGKGHDYKPKARVKQPRRLAVVVRSLDRWKSPFVPTYENLKELAAKADVTLKECEEALAYIKRDQGETAKVKKQKSKTKRAKTASKR